MYTLEQEVFKFQKKGWILLNTTEKTAQLHRPKRGFSCMPNLLWTLAGLAGLGLFSVGFIPGIVLFILGVIMPISYFFGWLFQREQMILLTVDEQGKIKRAKQRV